MKNVLISFTLISIVLLSCKKENHNQTTSPDIKLYPVGFSVSGTNQQIVPIDQKSKTKVNAVVGSDSSAINRLIYRVYDSSNTLKKTITINKGEPRFGSFQDSLAAGSYTAVFVGVIDVDKFRDNGTSFYYFDSTTSDEFSLETFYKKINFVVGSSNIQQNVVLQRINSQLQLIIKDEIPADITRISVYVTKGLGDYYSYLDAVVSDETYQYLGASVTSDKIGTTNFTITSAPSLLANGTPATVQITTYGSDGDTPASRKTINNVTLQPNKLTILTGNLFTPDSNPNSFSVSYNTIYNPDITQGY